jgi:hypothetical protein
MMLFTSAIVMRSDEIHAVISSYQPLRQHAHIEARVASIQLGARHARLADLHHRFPDTEHIADTHLGFYSSQDGEVLAEGAGLKVASQLSVPVRVVVEWVDAHRLLKPPWLTRSACRSPSKFSKRSKARGTGFLAPPEVTLRPS